jgi:1-acyl-sn-glycerol-3-phosphate acyltransferase
MSMVGYIPLSRGSRGSIRESFEDAADWLARNVSVLIFPEGTRSATGEIQSFKNGAFKLALQANAPVLPIVISGTRDAIPKGTWIFRHKVDALISIIPPVPPAIEESFPSLKQRVYESMAAELARIRQQSKHSEPAGTGREQG